MVLLSYYGIKIVVIIVSNSLSLLVYLSSFLITQHINIGVEIDSSSFYWIINIDNWNCRLQEIKVYREPKTKLYKLKYKTLYEINERQIWINRVAFYCKKKRPKMKFIKMYFLKSIFQKSIADQQELSTGKTIDKQFLVMCR